MLVDNEDQRETEPLLPDEAGDAAVALFREMLVNRTP
jgi:hypothetical protein